MTIVVEKRGPITVVAMDRPEARNAVDDEHSAALAEAFAEFDADPDQSVAILHGRGGHFCAGADLKAVAAGERTVTEPGSGHGPMGPTRMALSKPVIAAVDGYAVAGGLELAIWADLRIVDPEVTFGVFCRRWGVPLIDGGTVRLPRLIGHSHALDMILTGRPVGAEEAHRMGLANRISQPGRALEEAIELAEQLAAFPQTCLRQDRLSMFEQEGLTLEAAIANEWGHGALSLVDAFAGAARFAEGAGRHGSFGQTAVSGIQA
ncbi:enoyl-CoA hydratase [Nocardioides baekrokdamisoli]|uniref:Enoyl-CoA hydratase n=1 Tax=Nocardioides baekrokdamisoli TaxID=1804624 RepID=A0A3G9IYV2_9ACTN|nr:crotonase/enoyl-CoA hydratase family protein [Nocardioides baekrokdamisoli]BBH17563.1 enoyl-CoA hydratase [Nocardioides baekrokdamisoli]